MEKDQNCSECGGIRREGNTCQDDFYQMLYWENENPANGEVHHLMVLCYHLQHPSLYSPEGLRESIRLLAEFVDQDISPAEMVKRNQGKIDSGKRTWKITSRPDAHGAYPKPIQWEMTAADVVSAGSDRYRENVRAWARSIRQSLNTSGHDT